MNYQLVGDPETHTRIEQYELAFRMQSSVPELTDISNEPASTYALYGDEAKKPGTFAHSALLARRMVERGVRFVQIYHNNWDHHANVGGPAAQPVQGRRPALLGPDPGPQGARAARRDPGHLGRRVRPDDLLAGRPDPRELRPRPSPALLHDVDGRRRLAAGDDLRRDRRVLLQHRQGPRPHPRLPRHRPAPARLRPPRFTYRYQGLDQRLTGVEPARVIKELLA